jgi:di/tricarboxylate transporter
VGFCLVYIVIMAASMSSGRVVAELRIPQQVGELVVPVGRAGPCDVGLLARPLPSPLLIGASCSFLTPIGYQTNTMVYGMGGYRFADFTRLGAPLTLLTIVTSVILIPIVFPLS